MRPYVAALYIDPLGPYPTLAGVDCWDETRDARNYPGPLPVVAHPPCGPWGRLRHLCQNQSEADLAPLALAQVRQWGGVLEHPSHSKLWTHAGLPLPGEPPDKHGGWTLAVNQVDWGHAARKPTWLYLVGVPRSMVIRPARREPTHWISASRTLRNGRPRGLAPPGILICSAAMRRRTPVRFAEWLVMLARFSG